jgi:hypothetical protein
LNREQLQHAADLGVWLGAKPVDDDLKDGLLGKED